MKKKSLSATTPRNIVYVTEPTTPLDDIATSAFTGVVLSQCHIEQNPALQMFRILNGADSIVALFSASEFSQWIPALNDATFPDSLRAASAEDFIDAGEMLSNNVTVTVNTAGSSWTLTDNQSGNVFAMQVDLNGTFISFNGAPLTTITDVSTYTGYETSLNAGQFPPALQQAAGLQGPNSDYTITQLPAQLNGLSQWLLTNTTNGFIYFIGIGSQATQQAMVVHDYHYVFSPNVAAFMASIDAVVDAGIPVLVSLGGWADSTTWAIMGQDTQQALIVVSEFLDAFGLAGVDYDWEQIDESQPQQNADVTAMTNFTQALEAALPNVICTICPYGATITQLLQVWTNVGPDAIAWANCQYYSNEVAGFSETFLSPIASAFNLSPASAAAQYVVAGYTATGYTATTFASAVSALVQAIPNIAGVFTYNLGAITGSVQTWASDVANALAGNSQNARRKAVGQRR